LTKSILRSIGPDRSDFLAFISASAETCRSLWDLGCYLAKWSADAINSTQYAITTIILD
jgi:hypothetical protein